MKTVNTLATPRQRTMSVLAAAALLFAAAAPRPARVGARRAHPIAPLKD